MTTMCMTFPRLTEEIAFSTLYRVIKSLEERRTNAPIHAILTVSLENHAKISPNGSKDKFCLVLSLLCLAVSPVSHKVSSLVKCSTACEFGCEVQSKKCLCLRGYEMTAGGCQGMYKYSPLFVLAKN